MVGERDLPLYLIAAKSLLRFCSTLSVVVHSDGTLKAKSIGRLKTHLPGCVIIDAARADARAAAALGTHSFLARWRTVDVSYRRLIDIGIWTTTQKRIMMDSDVLVLRKPARLLEWINAADRPFMLGTPIESTPIPTVVDAARAHVQTIFRSKLREISRAMNLPMAFLQNAGACFYGCGGELSTGRIEQLIKVALALGVPMQRWGGEQCIVNYLLSATGAVALDPQCCVDFDPAHIETAEKAAIVHFAGTYRFHKSVYARCAGQVIRSLGTNPLTLSEAGLPGYSDAD
jgi:hypothetical protein